MSGLRFGSVCSGIEAASVAWEPLGFAPVWFSEIAPWPSKFLATRYPHVPNHGSLVGLADRLAGSDRNIDLLVGGTPCQAFSVAGLRGGLADERGNLSLEFARLAQALRPRWVLWENVPGVLSDDTAALTKSGRPPSIAFNARQDPVHPEFTTGALDTDGNSQAVCVTGNVTHALRSVGADASEDDTGRGTPIVTVAIRGREGGATAEVGGEVANALRSAQGGGSAPYVLSTRVRRLTPRECERLQGFPDDATTIPGTSDTARYAALGNSMTVPMMRWLSERITKIDTLLKKTA